MIQWYVPQEHAGGTEENARRMIDCLMYMRELWAEIQPPEPLRRSDFMLMGTLGQQQEEEAVTVSSLAKKMRQSVPGVSQKVSELEEQGYILRQANTKDKRSAQLSLSPKAEKLMVQQSRRFVLRMQQVLEAMGPEKATQLLHLLEELKKSAQEVQKEDATSRW